MSFKLAQDPKFKSNVEVWIKNDVGVATKSTFKATFKRVSTTDIERLTQGESSMRELLREKLVGWQDLVADDGTEIDYSKEVLEQLLDMPEALAGLSTALTNSIHIQKEKN